MPFRPLAATAACLLYAGAALAQTLTGLYTVDGRNPDGSSYSGQMVLTDAGDRITVNWTVGNQSYSGTGTLDGRVIEIDWGSADPVVYVIMPNGNLHGTWADGRALERAERQN
ncbi:hypothetical protein [Aestuariicoccus sp. MJ-SS9]|uniref:LIC10280 family protein n=1 Tax=Aestuariicoccus sp. MJ-SS9 TaxID=3079855 RepID=UPI00290925FD|nr:hypothetical protein [Aestuariicoccus sp. MJ-SS9]MDU8911115.1 hypothetical protein [Aestuariicoccus sp. MJ-SS9]